MSRRAQNSRKRTRIQLQNEQRIMNAALEVFSSYGYRGSTIDQIAERAGLSKPNLLYYFSSKEDIYVAVLEHTLSDWLRPLAEMDPDGEPADELWKYIERKLEMSRSAPKASRLFANEMLHGAESIKTYLRGELKNLVEEKCTVIQNWIDAGKLRPIAPVHLIFMIWATTQHYADFDAQIRALCQDSRKDCFDKAALTLKTIFLNGLLPQ